MKELNLGGLEVRAWVEHLPVSLRPILERAADAGVFSDYLTKGKVLDLLLGPEDREAILPSATLIKWSSDLPPGRHSETYDAVSLLSFHAAEAPESVLRFAASKVRPGGIIFIAYRRTGRLAAPERLLLDARAAWGPGSFQLRSFVDYPAGPATDFDPAEPGWSMAVLEYAASSKTEVDLPVIAIDRMSGWLDVKNEAVTLLQPGQLRSAGLSAEEVRSVCILKVDHIGDFLMGLPAFKELKAMFPNAELTLICGSWNHGLATSTGLFSRIVACDFFKERHRDGLSAEAERRLQVQLLGQAMSESMFDLVVDLRIHEDSRPLLRVVPGRCKAGFGDVSDWPFMDISMPNIEAMQVSKMVIPNRAELVWPPRSFHSGQHHVHIADVMICYPRNSMPHFVYGPYTKLGAGVYDGQVVLTNLGGGAPEIQFEVSTHISPIFVERFKCTELNSSYPFHFESFVDLDHVEFRLSLVEDSHETARFLFGGVKATFFGDTPPRRIMRRGQIHMTEQMMMLLSLIRGRLFDRSRPRLEISGLARDAGADYVVIAPYSNSDLRDWPESRFTELTNLILQRTDLRVELIGSRTQGDLMEGIRSRSSDPERVSAAAGESWEIVNGRLIGAAAVITNNSGIAHLADALGARLLSIYSNSHQVLEWGPTGLNSSVLQTNVACGPCGYDWLRECLHDHRCMTSITPLMVFDELQTLLRRERAEAPAAN